MNNKKYRLRLFIKSIIIKIIKIFLPFINIKDHVVFGTGYGTFIDNSKYLFLQAIESNNNCYFIIKNKDEFNKLKSEYQVLYYYNLKTIYIILTAKYFFFTQSAEDIFIYKRSETIGVCLWHATMIKHFGYDTSSERNMIEYHRSLNFPINYDNWDFVITSHQNTSFLFERATKLKSKQCIACGLPRNKLLYEIKDNNKLFLSLREEIINSCDLPREGEFILYAPTFRDQNKDNNIVTIESLIKRFYSEYKDTNIILLVRLHPGDNVSINSDLFNSTIINVGSYDDMQELLMISDVLITDYSSSIFDYSILERPILIYAYDLIEYSKYRGLYFDYTKDFQGYGLSFDEDELFMNISDRYLFVNKGFYKDFNTENASKNILARFGI